MALSSPRSYKPGRAQRGFTFIEMGAVIVVVVLAALVAMERAGVSQVGQRIRAFRADLGRVALVAREDASSTKRATLLCMSDAGDALEVRRTEADGNQTTILSVNMPDPIQAREYQFEGESTTADQWQINFFPDGTCESGGIGFWDGANLQFAVAFDPKTGQAVLAEGDIPNLSDDRWEAGDLEIRGGTGP